MESIWLLQFIFYIAICFILAVVMRGWIGFFAGIFGGILIIFILFISMSNSEGTFNERGR